MGWFNTKSKIDESVDDQTWLRSGHERFDKGKFGFFGSPETMLDGGGKAAAAGDLAASIFYYGKAMNIAQTWSFSKPGERCLDLDIKLFGIYADALEDIRRSRPGADVVTDWNNENVKYVLPIMISVAQSRGEPGIGLLSPAIRRVIASASSTPRVNGGTQSSYLSEMASGMGFLNSEPPHASTGGASG